MTPREAIAIIRKEYLCVDRDCDIERSCGKCDLNMPSKEPILQAYKMAIQALESQDRKQADGDYISRSKAISIINGWLKGTGYSWGERNVMKCMIAELEQLPTVAIPKERG